MANINIEKTSASIEYGLEKAITVFHRTSSANPTFVNGSLVSTDSGDGIFNAYIPMSTSTNPVMNGSVAKGNYALGYAAADHVHPSDTTKANAVDGVHTGETKITQIRQQGTVADNTNDFRVGKNGGVAPGSTMQGSVNCASNFTFDNLLGVTRVKTIPNNTTTTDTLAANQAWVNTYFALSANPALTGITTMESAKIGGVSNYSEFEADGTLKFNGAATCFLDVVIPFLYKGGAGEAPLDTFVGGIKNLQFDVGKFVYLENAEAPHDYKEGSEIELHIHWAVNAAMVAGDKVQWQLECAFANTIKTGNVGTIFCNPANPTVFGTKIMTVEYTSPVGGTPAGSNIYSSFGTILATDMANVKIGAGFLGAITRIAKSAGGTEAGNGKVFGLNMGIHYEVDTVGSRTRANK